MSARHFTLEIDRIVVAGPALGTATLERIRDRVETELARAIRGASWPNDSLDTASVRAVADARAAGEHAIADNVIAAVLRAIGKSSPGESTQ